MTFELQDSHVCPLTFLDFLASMQEVQQSKNIKKYLITLQPYRLYLHHGMDLDNIFLFVLGKPKYVYLHSSFMH